MSSDPALPRRRGRTAVTAAVAVLSLTLGGIALAQTSPFTDIAGNVHEDNINLLYELGITVGTSPTTYGPRENVRRDQMASFLINTLDHAHPQLELEWILEFQDDAFVLPDGTTFTDDDEVDAQLEALQDEEELPPVGSQLFFTENIWSVDDAGDPDEVIGTDHINCVVEVEPGRFSCDAVFEIDDVGSLYATTSVNFLEVGEDEDFPIDLAVTGGTGDFFGATGELTVLDEAEPEDEDLTNISGTVLLHGTR